MRSGRLYHERQEGDLCRMHALNHLVQRRALEPATFEHLLADFAADHPALPDPRRADAVDASQEYVMTYGVERVTNRQCTTFSVPLHYREDAVRMLSCAVLEELVDEKERAFFVYNPDHIWAVRQMIDGKWAAIDSLYSAPRVYADVRRLVKRTAAKQNHGILMVWGRAKVQWACNRLRDRLRTVVGDTTAVRYVREHILYSKNLLGELEVPLALYCRYSKFLHGGDLGDAFFAAFTKAPGDQENLLLRLTPLLATVLATK